MEATFLFRFKRQPAAFKKGVKSYGEGDKWYEPNFSIWLYERIVKNNDVRGILEVELKCLIWNKKIANVKFKIDKNKSLDELIYNALILEKEKMGENIPNELEQLLADLRHVFKWNEKLQNKNVEMEGVLSNEVKNGKEKDEISKHDESTISEKPLEFEAENKIEWEETMSTMSEDIPIQFDLLKDLEGDCPLDESSLMAIVANKNIQKENLDEPTSLALVTAKMEEVKKLMKQGVQYLIDISHLAGKSDPISIKKQNFIFTNYKTLFLEFLKEQHEFYAEKKSRLEQDAKEQLKLKSQGIKQRIKQENEAIIKAELKVFCLDLELKFDEKKKIERQKLEEKLQREFDEAVGDECKRIEDKVLLNLTPEQASQMQIYHQEVEDMIKSKVDVIIHESAARFQSFIDNVKNNLKRKQLEFEREQDLLELKEELEDKLIQMESTSKENLNKQYEMILANQEKFQKQMMEILMSQNRVEQNEDGAQIAQSDGAREKSAGILAYLIIVAIIFTVGFFFIFQLDFVQEVLSGFFN